MERQSYLNENILWKGDDYKPVFLLLLPNTGKNSTWKNKIM